MKDTTRLITATAICALLGSTAFAAGTNSSAPESGKRAAGTDFIQLAQTDCDSNPNSAACLADKVKEKVGELVDKAKDAVEPALPEPGKEPQEQAVEGEANVEAEAEAQAETEAPAAEDPVKEAGEAVGETLEKAGEAASETAKDAREAVEDAVEATGEAIDETIEKTNEAAGDLVEDTGETANQATEETEETVEDAARETGEAVDETVQEAEEAVEDTARETEEAVEDTVRETGEAVDETVQEAEEAVEDTARETEEAVEDAAPEAETDVTVESETDAEADASAEGERAPVLDSMKEAIRDRIREGRPRDEAEAEVSGETEAEAAAEADAPDSDAEAQAEIEVEVESVTSEEGRRVDRPRREERRERRDDDGEVVREFGDRIIIRFGDEIRVERRDRDDRVERGAREVYYEELSNGRTREVVERRNGVKVVTIRNRYGDILHRAKIYPDGREVVLFHVDRRNYDRIRDRREAGWDLPPMRLTIPVEEYILEARRVRDRQTYYEFLSQPPVERVERTYAIAEVTESPRIRDKARRIDLDTINFDFNSAVIDESQIEKLDGIAWAIGKMLEEDPAETFLIEGHTDAVGSDLYNLALSDERADAVIDALVNYYELPPENFVAQGYGEQFLKIETEARNRENRRVAIRRITPLVAPVASAE